MTPDRTPTISAVIAAYQAERWIAEALEGVLGQTRPPDEVVVVDDGSTDGTARELARFAGSIRVVRRPNGGCPAAFNTAFAHARGDFVAMCGADDVWEPRKLEWQAEAMAAHPEVDVLFGDAIVFGEREGTYGRPPGTGVLDRDALRDALYRENFICAPSIVIRRSLFERLGPFVEDFGADDYEYWMRCLRAGASFHYDPRPLLRYRRHDANLSSRLLWMRQCSYEVRRRYAADVPDRALTRRALSADLFDIGRRLADEGDARGARRALRASMRRAPSARAAVWLVVLQLPEALRAPAGDALVTARRTAAALR